MNKAITDGLVLMPPSFSAGLGVWSAGDGTPGSTTYDGVGTAAVVPGDADFGACLEVLKTDSVQKLRWTGETPILPGCYLRVTARMKAISGPIPSIRIAGWASDGSDVHIAGLVEIGSSAIPSTYGEVVEVSAIIGSGPRIGVDLVWGTPVVYGHIGIDLTGPTGGVVRIDDIRIEDATDVFHRTMMDWVDVRDYGAAGDGVTDCTDAFLAANAAALGRGILVPEGVYTLSDDVTLEYAARFTGTVTLPADKALILRRNFDLPSYAAAFGDEETGFRRGLQALLAFADHESFDLGGRRIEVTGPIDMAAAAAQDTFEIRRVIRNGQFNVVPGPAWDTGTVTSLASYDAAQPHTLASVANVANVEVGSLVTGTGVGREVYVDGQEHRRRHPHALATASRRAREPDLHLHPLPLRPRLLGLREAVEVHAHRHRGPLPRRGLRRPPRSLRRDLPPEGQLRHQAAGTGASQATGPAARTSRSTAATSPATNRPSPPTPASAAL